MNILRKKKKFKNLNNIYNYTQSIYQSLNYNPISLNITEYTENNIFNITYMCFKIYKL